MTTVHPPVETTPNPHRGEEPILESVSSFIVDNFLFGETADAPKRSTSFSEAGIIDSTGVLELIEFLEDTFEIAVEDHEMSLDNLDSLAKVAGFVARKMDAKNRVAA